MPNPDRRKFIKSVGAASTVGLAGCLSSGQGEGEFPSGNLTHIVPYGEGGGSDTYARAIVPEVAEALSVNIEIQNRPGAESISGITHAFTADDEGATHVGHTLPTAGIAWNLNPTDEDLSQLQGVALYGRTPYVIFANPEEEIEGPNDLADRYEDGDLEQFGGSLGAANHVAMITLRDEGDVPWGTWVVYDGSGPTVQAAASGEIPAGTATDAAAAGAAEEGNIDMICTLTSEPSGVFPDLETTADAGWTNVDFAGAIQRTASVGPDVPEENIEILADAYETAVNSEAVQEWSDTTGNEVYFRGPEETQQAIDEAFSIDDKIDLEELQ